MSRRCIALLSGGLDSMLAIRIMQRQGIEVEALNFKTLFTCCQNLANQAAQQLDVPLTVMSHDEDYLELVRRPQFGYGKGANPCVDCRIYMFQRARHVMDALQADFLVSGEVVGQRPMSQKKRDLHTISHHTQLDDLLLRPLSALVLPPTLPERAGWVDRRSLYGFVGRSRKGLIELAREFGLESIPTPSSGCALTEPPFARKVFDLLHHEAAPRRWDFELLKYGRHFRFAEQGKVVLGRNEAENQFLRDCHSQPDAHSYALLEPVGFPGPSALVCETASQAALAFAAALITRFGRADDSGQGKIRATLRDGSSIWLDPGLSDEAERARPIPTQRPTARPRPKRIRLPNRSPQPPAAP